MPAETEHSVTDVTQFGAAHQVSDPAAMIELFDRLKRLLHRPKAILLDRLSVQRARVALDVRCGTGDDVAEMAGRMPAGGEAVGVDASEAMLAEARRRHSGLGAGVAFRLGDVLALPYPDNFFDVCRAETVFVHAADPRQVVDEMARVTRPGGRVGALEIDEGSFVLDHPGQQLTRTILGAYSDSMACGWAGRQLPRLFRQAGLTGVSVDPVVVLGPLEMVRALLGPTVTGLCARGALTEEQASGWWAALIRQAEEGDFLGGAIAFAVTGTRPA
jgi:ubiquinone/menaquinone biosynthesis C-methylase UbiE